MREASSYGIVDRKLLFDRYLNRMSHKGAALYLFLVLAADRDGRSYYSDRSIGEILCLAPTVLAGARSELIKAGLIDYRRPDWWVKTLSQPKPVCRPEVGHDVVSRQYGGELKPIRGIVPEGLRTLLKSMEEKNDRSGNTG